MIIALILIVWWITGFIAMFLYHKAHFYKALGITLGDIVVWSLFGICGPITATVVIVSAISESNFWDKRIF